MIEQKIDEILENINQNASVLRGCDDYHNTYQGIIVKEVSLDGLWLEFGVYRGRSITSFAQKNGGKMIYGFDSFEGLPDFWDGANPKGVYSLNGEVPAGAILGPNVAGEGMYDTAPTSSIQPWPENVRLIKGWFEDTLPKFLEEHKEQVAFVHIDSDIYSACKTVLTLLKDRIKPNTIIAFDELLDYHDYRNHEIKAFAEFLIDTGFNYKALHYQKVRPDTNYTQVCFKII